MSALSSSGVQWHVMQAASGLGSCSLPVGGVLLTTTAFSFPFFVFFLPFAVGNNGRVVVQVAGSIAKWWCEGESSTRRRSRSGVAQQLSDYKGMSLIVTLENQERISVTEWPVRF